MSMLGLHLTLLIGPTVPVPVPPTVLELLDSIEVTHTDDAPSGFQLVFKATRSTRVFLDFPLFLNPQFRPGNRVIISASFGPVPTVLMDGIIANQQLTPPSGSDPAILTLMGEDITLKMDLEEKSVEHPAQSANIIALKIIANYAVYGLIPIVIPPLPFEVSLPVEAPFKVQRATDLRYLNDLAKRHAYVFYVKPGPAIGTNTAYWGPPIRVGVPQRALTVDMGPETNVESISFEHNATEATTVEGEVQDRTTNQRIPIMTFLTTRPPLALNLPFLNPSTKRLERAPAESGQSAVAAQAQAQAQTDASMDVVKVEGELNTASYGAPLEARGLVGLRGVGFSYDGLYYVKKVTHTIKTGQYRQKFTLTREGTGSTVPTVIP